MASIINASSSGSGGIVQTADASGVLQLQANGTVAIQYALSSGNVQTTQSGNLAITGTDTSTYTFSVTNTASGTNYGGNGARLAFFRSSTAAAADQPGIDIGYNVAQNAGIIAGSTNATGTPITFWTYDGATWAERVRVAKAGYLTTPYQPAFSAINGTDFQFPSGGGTKQILANSLINIGSCYNTSTGRFTAPVAGLYEIGFGGTVSSSGSDQYPTGFFYKNGAALSNGCRFRQFFTASGQYASIGGLQYVQLTANDYIEYYFYSQSGNAYANGNEFQVFARLIG